jgi:mono/diheme cytochrome c family protein
MRKQLAFVGTLLLVAGTALAAGTGDPARDAILAGYADAAKAADPAFAGFSAERGRQLYLGPHTGGDNPTITACAACHTPDPRRPGQHAKTGRAIDPMAVSVTPTRFTDAADVEKRFGRDCPSILGRDCTAQEKGDFITYLASQ